MVEHLVCNQVVVGSNPVASTTLAALGAQGRAESRVGRRPGSSRAQGVGRRGTERGRKRESTERGARAQCPVIFENEVGCRKKK